MKIIGWVCLLWLAVISNVSAVPIAQDEIPPALQEWVPWVLHGEQQQLCPFSHQQFDNKRCRWPVNTSLELTNTGGHFEQQWTVETPQWVPLVGRNDQWPVQVRVDGQIQSVIRQGNKPHVFLSEGEHQVVGEFNWPKLPKTVALPTDNGLLKLTVNGKVQAFPKLEKGVLWLQKNTVSTQQLDNDSLTIDVQRHLKDAIPFEVTTRIELTVSGSEREIQLSGALLEGFIAQQLTSPLPARLESDGSLRVQAKAGQWQLTLTSRAPEQVEKVQASPAVKPWPEQEVWVFQSQPDLRQVNVSGASAIDPKNTRLPRQWHQWPAYQVDSESTLAFEQKQRGDATQQQDQLSLHRTWWLDFDGQGFSLQDRITGQVHGRYRLPMNAAIKLGRVAVNGEDQFITKLAGDDKQGVELRLGKIDVVADSQWQGGFTLPATGWDADFQKVSTQLNMPPGWRLLAVSGVDKSTGSWLSRWTLLDLFLVFIIAASFSHLWGKAWGGVALFAMVVLYHEQGAPIAVWLNALAATALLKVLPTGKFKVWMQRYFYISVAGIVLISLPFMVQQARQGLYPQLEYSNHKVSPQAISQNDYENEAELKQQRHSEKALSSMVDSVSSVAEYAPSAMPARNKRDLTTYSPDTKVQTGPGLPSWQWRSSQLSFNGPVDKSQTIDLWLLSPLENRLLAVSRIALLVALLACVVGWRKGINLKSLLPLFATVMVFTTTVPSPAMANSVVPDQTVLQQLKQRLLAAPDCMPDCAVSSTMQLKLESDQLVIRQTVDVAQHVLVPLPGQQGHWTPQQVLVDGQPSSALSHDKQGRLWISLATGQHELLMTGQVPPQVLVQLMLPLKPQHLSTITDESWLVEGNMRSGHVSDLLLKRNSTQQTTEKQVLTPTSLPAFIKVERRLTFNQQWQVHTKVTRLTKADSVVRLSIPLIENEQVLTEGLQIDNGEMKVQLRQGQKSFQWRSLLTQTESLNLQAKKTDEWVEYWTLSWQPIWHVKWHGLPLIANNEFSNVLWRPWPGEQLMLQVERPAGEQGQTLTLDQSILKVRPGQRSSDVELNLSFRSSLGQQHTIALPEGAQLGNVTVAGKKLPLQLLDSKLTLPINPGEQPATINWRQPAEITTVLSTPVVQLGLQGVNNEVELFMPKNRWILAVGGPSLGPAVLVWGVLIVLIIVAYTLARFPLTPLKTQHWILLFLGLTQASMVTLIAVVGWLIALGLRQKRPWMESRAGFNFVQIGLGFWTLIALSSLFLAIEQGLLGQPEMQIVGNGSYSNYLHWYQDHSGDVLPQAWVISVPLYIYRGLMLLWALWLAFALLGWLRWGWQCFSQDGIWRHVTLDMSSTGWGKIRKQTEEKDES